MAYDLYAEVNQTSCDKLLASTAYPLTVVEQREPFPGCANMAALQGDGFYKFTPEEVAKLFKDCVSMAGRDTTASVHDQVFAFGGTILQQAKVMLDASGDNEYEGPTAAELKAIIDGGIENLGSSLRSFLGDWGIYAWCPLLRVRLTKQPHVGLQSPRIDLTGVAIDVMATGELWAKYPWWNCYKWCLKWRKVTKCDRIASVTASVDIAAAAHAVLAVKGVQVFAGGEFDRLRLAYPILDKIPLEGLANRGLKGKEILVYDGSLLIATVPVLSSKFVIDALDLPAKPDAIGIGVNIRKI